MKSLYFNVRILSLGTWWIIVRIDAVYRMNNGEGEKKYSSNDRQNGPGTSEVGVNKIGSPFIPPQFAIVTYQFVY